MYSAKYSSPLGEILLTCSNEGLTGLWLNREVPETEDAHPILEKTKQWLDDYFRGKVPAFSVPLEPEGTEFQKKVWDILLTVPFAQTCTYGDIAREMAHVTGREKMSAQAVGQAVGRNPISIIIPCHRCIGVGGKLTGYASGLDKKVWLLNHEQAAGPKVQGQCP